jgi:palmitoyl-protein thioesterase
MRPVLLWHGMGATADSLGEVAAMLQEALNTSVYSIQIGSKDEDQKYSFFDRIDRQVKLVCDYLQSDPIYSNGYDAIGFSQGGLFLRALVQSCPIKANSLITLGSPHGGVSDIPRCSNSNDVNCSLMRSIVNQGVYWSWIQQRVVQAQYFKQWSNPAYKKSNIFLPKINNELAENQEYKARLQSLSKFVMVMFTNDTQVVPKETAVFKTNQVVWILQ